MGMSEWTAAQLVDAWREGSQEAATLLFERYVVRLTALARARLSRRLARRVDPEELVMSAYRSFFVRARDGRVTLAPFDDLWPLLVTITLRKLARRARGARAERRDIDREVPFDEAAAGLVAWRDTLADSPGPEHAALVADEVEWLLAQLSSADREVLTRQLQGLGATEIAAELNVSDRTVRRSQERIRRLLADRADYEPAVVPAEDVTVQLERPMPMEQCGGTEAGPLIASTIDESPSQPNRVDADVLVQRYVGQGGFGRVYRGFDRVSGETVAIKFLKKRFWRDTEAVKGLLREYELLRDIRHPYVVGCKGYGRSVAGAPFLVLEWIDGSTLGEWVARAAPSVVEMIGVLRDMARGLAFAHSHGILHGDLTPANVMRRTSGAIILTDFGLSQCLGVDGRKDIVRGGTVGFLAPEQVSAVFGPVTERTDVYGLGAVAYAILTGRPPSVGRDRAEALATVLSAHAPPNIDQLNPKITAPLSELVMRAIAKEPANRLATATEFATQFDAWLVANRSQNVSTPS